MKIIITSLLALFFLCSSVSAEISVPDLGVCENPTVTVKSRNKNGAYTAYLNCSNSDIEFRMVNSSDNFTEADSIARKLKEAVDGKLSIEVVPSKLVRGYGYLLQYSY